VKSSGWKGVVFGPLRRQPPSLPRSKPRTGQRRKQALDVRSATFIIDQAFNSKLNALSSGFD
jgi:hypothetical protein